MSFESKITKEDFKILRKGYIKDSSNLIINIIVLLVIACFLLNICLKKIYWLVVVFDVVMFLLLAFYLVGLIKLLQMIYKDIKHKIKIKTELTVVRKTQSDLTEDIYRRGIKYRKYKIFFKKNDCLDSYQVSSNAYFYIQKGDVLEIELTKYEKRIIRITHNSKDVKFE